MSRQRLDDPFNNPVVERQADLPLTREDVLNHLRWGKPQEVETKKGTRIRTVATANPEAIALFAREGPDLYALGYTLSEWPVGSGKRQVTKWELVPEKVVIKRQEAAALSRATDADIDIPRPDGLNYLGYQKAGIAGMLQRFQDGATGCLLADEQGLGKTVQAAGIIACLPDITRILVICPASLRLNWRNELMRWQVKRRSIFVCDSKFFPAIDGICIINYDVLDRHEEIIKGTEWDLLISDEAHYLKGGSKTKRGKFVLGERATKKEIAAGMASIPGIQAKRRMFLTGTPISNRPAELFPLISYLDPEAWPNFFQFAKRYCSAHDNGFGWDFTGASRLPELQEKLRSSGLMIRRLKQDVLKDLPPKRHQVIEIEAKGDLARFAKAERDAYDGREEEIADLQAAVELAKASDDPDDHRKAVQALKEGIGAIFGSLSTFRKELAVAKIPLCVEHLRDAIEAEGKIVTFCHHKEVARKLAAEFGAEAVMLVGDTPMQERQDAVDRFQKDPAVKLFIGSITAAGVGITLTASSNVVFCEHSWVPGEMAQAADRCHRIGQKGSVLIQYLVVEGSLDATMAKRIVAKQSVITQALDVCSPAPDAEALSKKDRQKPFAISATANNTRSITAPNEKPTTERDIGTIQKLPEKKSEIAPCATSLKPSPEPINGIGIIPSTEGNIEQPTKNPTWRQSGDGAETIQRKRELGISNQRPDDANRSELVLPSNSHGDQYSTEIGDAVNTAENNLIINTGTSTMSSRFLEEEIIPLEILSPVAQGAISARDRESTTSKESLATDAAAMTQDQKDAANEAIKLLASRCNGARSFDGAGFSKLDAAIGKSLASQRFLTPKQAALARKIVWKYRVTQLPPELTARL